VGSWRGGDASCGTRKGTGLNGQHTGIEPRCGGGTGEESWEPVMRVGPGGGKKNVKGIGVPVMRCKKKENGAHCTTKGSRGVCGGARGSRVNHVGATGGGGVGCMIKIKKHHGGGRK